MQATESNTSDYLRLSQSIRQHMRYIEAIVDTAEVPVDAQQQATSRTLMWATQHASLCKNDYLSVAAYSNFKSALQLLENEIDLALNPSFRQTRQLIWNGVRDALDNPPVGSPMEQLKKRHLEVLQRASLSEYSASEVALSWDMSDDNLDYALSSTCEKLSLDQGNRWLIHRIILSKTVEDANETLNLYHATFPQVIKEKMPPFTPVTLQLLRLLSTDEMHQKLQKYRHPEEYFKQIDLPEHESRPGEMPIELEDALETAGVGKIKTQAMALESADPEELMGAIAAKYDIPIVSMEQWKKNGMPRDKAIVIRNFDFKTLKQPELGRAQFMAISPTPNTDVRIELKTQTVSGSAGDKLPVTVYRLKKIADKAPYSMTLIGVTNTTFFSPDALELAEMQAQNNDRILLCKDQEVMSKLHTTMKLLQAWHTLDLESLGLGEGTLEKPAISTAPTVVPTASTRVPATSRVIDEDSLFGSE